MTDSSTPAESADRPRILVPIDFSEDSRAAVLWASQYARCVNAELVLLHVVHDPASSPGFYRQSEDSFFKPMQTVAESMMEDFLQEMAEDHPELAFITSLRPRFVPGLPPTRIVEAAGLVKACLIVIGSRGLTGLPHRMVGSTSERVVELASMPVLVVKSEDHGQLDEKAQKKQLKKQKKETRKLRKLLGLGKKKASDGDDHG